MNAAQFSSHSTSGLSTQRCQATQRLLPNRVRNFERFHISYNSHTSDYGSTTTALVLQGRVFFVLNGDHVSEMIEAAEQLGVQGCIAYFINRIHEANALSEHQMAVELAADPFGLHQTTLEMIGQDSVDRIVAAMNRLRA